MTVVRRWGRALLAVSLVVCALGVVLRLTVRDRWPALAPLYYATPLPVVAGAVVLTALVACRARRGRIAAALAAAAVVVVVWFVVTSWHAAPDAAPDAATAGPGAGTTPAQDVRRVALWNVSRGTFGWSSLAGHLALFDADVVCLVESRRLVERDAELRRALPGHTIVYAPGGFTLASRIGLRDVQPLALPRGRAVRACVGAADTADLVLVDVPPDPFGDRGPALAALCDARPRLLLGDFNTPRSSAHFDPLRVDHVHAFEAAGRGFVETWPWPLPVLDLDHVWVRAPLRVLACRYERRLCSDHCAVIVDLAVR